MSVAQDVGPERLALACPAGVFGPSDILLPREKTQFLSAQGVASSRAACRRYMDRANAWALTETQIAYM